MEPAPVNPTDVLLEIQKRKKHLPDWQLEELEDPELAQQLKEEWVAGHAGDPADLDRILGWRASTTEGEGETEEGGEVVIEEAEAELDRKRRCFLGNLSYTIRSEDVREFFKDCGRITDIHWLTDKVSDEFCGSAFIAFGTPEETKAALAKAGEDLMGRPLKIDLAKPRAPRADGSAAGGFKKKPFEVKPLGPKPDGCNTVFMGNLSYQIDEDAVKTFFADCGEISNIRWLTDRETGDFKGCGFCEFASSDSVDGVVAKNGQDLMGRPVRLDYSTPKPYDYSTPRRCSPFLSVSLSVCLSVCAAFVLTLCPLYLQWTVGRRSGKVCQHSSSLVLPDEMGMDCDSRLYTNTCVFS